MTIFGTGQHDAVFNHPSLDEGAIDVMRGRIYVPADYGPFKNGMRQNRSGSHYYCGMTVGNVIRARRSEFVKSERAEKAFLAIENAYEEHKGHVAVLQERTEIDVSGWEHPPMGHQLDAIQRLLGSTYGALIMDCGLGKTYTMIKFLEESIKRGKKMKTLVICPLSIIKHAWMADVLKFSRLIPVNLRNLKGRFGADTQGDVFIINIDIVDKYKDRLIAMGFDVLLIDESSKCKSPTANRTNAVIALSRAIEHRYIMTGTPSPNGILDLWSQYYIVDHGMSLGAEFSEYRSSVCRSVLLPSGISIWRQTRDGIDRARKAIAPATLRYALEDADLVLPPKRIHQITFPLSPSQRRAYDELKEDMVTRVDGDRIRIKAAIAELNKLQQICGGYVLGEDKNVIKFPSNPKMKALLDLIDSIGSRQAIVWAWFKHEIEAIHKKVSKTGVKCEFIHGDVSSRKREKIIDNFINNKFQILVANPGTIGHGLTLVNAHYNFYYSENFDLEYDLQSGKRTYRKGQEAEEVFYYYLLAENSVDILVRRSLDRKEGVQLRTISVNDL